MRGKQPSGLFSKEHEVRRVQMRAKRSSCESLLLRQKSLRPQLSLRASQAAVAAFVYMRRRGRTPRRKSKTHHPVILSAVAQGATQPKDPAPDFGTSVAATTSNQPLTSIVLLVHRPATQRLGPSTSLTSFVPLRMTGAGDAGAFRRWVQPSVRPDPGDFRGFYKK